MKRRGRPVLGAISGLLLGLFVAVDLMLFKVYPLDTLTVVGLPLIGLLIGLVLGLWAPFGRRQAATPQPPAAPAAPPPAS